MFPLRRFPYSSFENINLDWICRKLTELETRLNELDPGSATGIVAIEHGGTGADNAADALDNLGVEYPVKSVNNKTGYVVLDASDVGALPDTYTPPAAPVDSVNGKTGTVVLDYSDVGALPDTYTPPAAPVDSVNGQTGTVVLDYSDVGALPDTYTPPAAPVDSVNGNTGAVVLSFGDVGAIGIYKGPNAVAGGTAYDLTGTDYNNFLIIVGSPNGSENNSLYYANLTYDKVRLLGAVVSGLTVSISSGILTIASASYQANVWICPLPG